MPSLGTDALEEGTYRGGRPAIVYKTPRLFYHRCRSNSPSIQFPQ